MKEFSLTKRIVWEVFDLCVLAIAIPFTALWYTFNYAHPMMLVATFVLIYPTMAIVEDFLARAYWTKAEYALYERD
jgi:hypothetical protein